VEKELMDKIIEGVRFAPSGHNSQSTEFLVVQDTALLRQITELTIEYLKFEVRRFSNPFFNTFVQLSARELAESGIHEILGFKRLIQSFEVGLDPILCQAPTLLVFHARRHAGFADINASLAVQNASLVAHASGVGHFIPGFVIATCRAPLAPGWGARLTRLIGLPPKNQVYGALALGYPIPKFKYWIERRPPQVKWL
jgi:nitroreductase